ncbi:MAG TPA: aspartate--tRNA(Asn) ligase [Candidatus Saccharimonadales bacterium]
MRLLSSELKTHVGETVHIEGWLHKKRLLGGLTFVNVRDRSGLTQVVIKDKEEVEKLRGLQIGTVLTIDGTAVEEPRAPGGVELHDAKVTVLVPVETEPPIEIDKPLSHKPENLDTLFDNRVLGVRNLQEQKIFKTRATLVRNIREFLQGQDFVEINSPKIVAGAAEGGAEVFKLDYFGQEATLAQSPQLYKQMMVGAFERVYEIGPAFRAEPSATTRHVSEVTMLDIEMGFIEGHEEVLDMIQNMVYAVLHKTYEQLGDDLKSLNAPELTLTEKFPRYSMAKIHEMYQAATGKDMTHEIDLTPDEEKWICAYAKEHDGCEAVFATDLPISKMKFYHMKGDDGASAKSADLLFRGVEIATCPQREHRYDKLVEQMKAAGVDPEHPGFSHYLLAFKHGLPAHGGCGFGIDRFAEKTIGLGNAKEAILFPRDINRLTP